MQKHLENYEALQNLSTNAQIHPHLCANQDYLYQYLYCFLLSLSLSLYIMHALYRHSSTHRALSIIPQSPLWLPWWGVPSGGAHQFSACSGTHSPLPIFPLLSHQVEHISTVSAWPSQCFKKIIKNLKMLFSGYRIKSAKSNTTVVIALVGHDLKYNEHKTFIALRK